MEKAKQFQTALVGTFSPRQNGTQEAVDAFTQPTVAPGVVHYLAEGLPGGQQLLDTDQPNGFHPGSSSKRPVSRGAGARPPNDIRHLLPTATGGPRLVAGWADKQTIISPPCAGWHSVWHRSDQSIAPIVFQHPSARRLRQWGHGVGPFADRSSQTAHPLAAPEPKTDRIGPTSPRLRCASVPRWINGGQAAGRFALGEIGQRVLPGPRARPRLVVPDKRPAPHSGRSK